MRRLASAFLLAAALLGPGAAAARVERIEILSRSEMALGYERIDAKVHFVLDPAHPRNRAIADLELAEKPSMVADLVLLRPPAGGNGLLHLEIPNRGNPGRQTDFARREFLLRRGYTIAFLGWQWDIRDQPDLLRLEAPIARGLAGQVRADFIVESPREEHPVGHLLGDALGGKGPAVAGGDDPAATLTERDDVEAPRRPIPRQSWRFTEGGKSLRLAGGFQPGRIYELIYQAENPAIAGAGFAAVRDFVSYLKHDPQAVAPVKFAIGFGVSQCGRFLRHFVYEGFNADEEGRQVFDGLLVHLAGAGRGNFNHRFAQPSRDAGQIVPAFYPVDLFPFTDLPTTDPATGKTAGLLDRAAADRVLPKIFYLNTGYEYWGRAASLIHTTPDGKADVEPAPTSRIYQLGGHGHVGGPFPPEKPERARELQSFLDYWPLTHGLVDAMAAWITAGKEPPPSRYPRIASGELVPPEQVAATLPEGARPMAYRPFRTDAAEPPKILGHYPTLVPQTDADGNELGGVRMPFLTVPLGAYRPFNLRQPAAGFPQHRISFLAAFVPFPQGEPQRRYPSREAYLGRFTTDTLKLIEERYLADDDLHPLLARALELWDWAAARPRPPE